ncbi:MULTISPECIES: PRD domain-containing protein [unclassified Bartonella]|uniref:PRD domain-containing protein n=1 Tax=unclassified Bartonella TaxID=2645622 RepID=UPI0021C91AFC|nr:MULTISPECIES: PRD domain-containing protein [unclassified Bartonella]UXN05057.1 PRD domain-containing protein [Bartonella sp. HY406]UXN08123.1 PRD domain-containing protein [Bartonella sp. HY761]
MSNQLQTNATETIATQIQTLATNAMVKIPDILQRNGKAMDDEQIEKLSAHVFAMARRALTNETLPEFDKSLFDEVSEKSISTAREIVGLFDGLSDDETYLLSIHFEVAQDL